MGAERSIRAVGQKLGKSRATVETFSRRWNWVERTRAWDNEITKQAKAQAVKEAKGMQARHLQLAMIMQRKALEALSTFDPDMLDGNIVVKLIVEGTKLERSTRLDEAADQGNIEQGSSQASNRTLAEIIRDAHAQRKGGTDD